MRKRQNTSQGATALRSTISAVLISLSVILVASSFKAAPAATELGNAIAPSSQMGGWTVTGSLNTSRAKHTATLLPSGKVLVAGGIHADLPRADSLNSAELYDPASGIWTFTGSLGVSRRDYTATFLASGKVLVAGGRGGTNIVALASAELYNPASGTWSGTGSLHTWHEQHTATLLSDGKVLLAGGGNDNIFFLASAELYDPATGIWMVTGSLNTARKEHTATLLPSGKVLVTGGYGPGLEPLSTAELYDPANGSWTVTGSLHDARRDHTATLLPNGKVLVAGGSGTGGGFAFLSSAELYDPASGNWTLTGSLNTARDFYTATLLPNGQVLVAAGRLLTLTTAELYDPTSGKWAATDSVAWRFWHTATLLHNGQVLVAGGEDGSGYLSSAELYDPGLGTCSVCHKRTLTLSLPCGTFEYQRHLDHGDTLGTCPPSKKDTAQTDSLGHD